MNNIKFVYFGGEPLGVPVLEELKAAGFLPSLIVASPDRPVGRKQVMTPPPVKMWGEENDIPVIQPVNLKNLQTGVGPLFEGKWDLFVVVAYNKILPEWLTNLPKHKTLNLHPSLLPLLRGASPIRSAIMLNMKDEIGVSVIQLDKKMDHGPIVTQKHVALEEWPMAGPELDALLAREGGRLLAATLPGYVRGDFDLQEQEHEYATYCTRFEKADSELTIDPYHLPTGEKAYQVYLKICALKGMTDTFFVHEGQRIKINEATQKTDSELDIVTVTPAGDRTQPFSDWLKKIT